MTPDYVADCLDGLIYGALFDCPLTPSEIHRFSRRAVGLSEIETVLSLDSLRDTLNCVGGYYFLQGNDRSVARRVASRARAERYLERCLSRARFLQYLPFVRGLVLTGSVAAGDAAEDADIDLLVICAEGRLSLVFAILGAFARLTGRRYFCPNFYLCQGHLEVERRNHYVAREIAQAWALTGLGAQFFADNSWTLERLPNAEPRSCPVNAVGGGFAIQAFLERLLDGRFGDLVNALLSRLAWSRLKSHYNTVSGELPEIVERRFHEGREIRFHNAPRLRAITERYEQRRQEFLSLLQALWLANDARERNHLDEY